ncbi:Phosphoribosylaminoimidazole-succinocarboxamide synthase [Atractiella rhizophila]|nr:Phosphoribosylaminoimidazole-succinocarboxamide synthase [Atractiella rhizophila]
MSSISSTDCPTLTLVARGKVRDIYSVPSHPDRLLFVATDRVSAFDYVMKTPIPSKGSLLSLLSLHFFQSICPLLPIEHHVAGFIPSPKNSPSIKASLGAGLWEELPEEVLQYREQLEGRSIWVKKCEVLKVEAIVRGYLTGSAWREYEKSGTVHGMKMPEGLKNSSKFPEPIFTPSTKADQGEHDENIHPDELHKLLPDPSLAEKIKSVSISLYSHAAAYCEQHGLLLADTKMEFGLYTPAGSSERQLMLIDEFITPDSSRFWIKEEYKEGSAMVGIDKEGLRAWLKARDGGPGEVELPEDVVVGLKARYTEAWKRLTGHEWVD